MDDLQHQERPTASARKKIACAECRQQKTRCDGPLNSPSCSRCSRLDIPCVFSAPFKRTHKRKRIQELEEETTVLKRQLLAGSPAAAGNPVRNGDTPQLHGEDTDVVMKSAAHLGDRNKQSIDYGPTLSRTIDGLELSSSIIDDCFELYFKNYHFMLPILDPSVTPNTVYQNVPSLFWVIVSVGSRRYIRQPTLTQTLALPVTQLVLQSVIIRNKPIERMKGLLLLLTWPFPSGPFYRDPCFVFAGILLHVAMHCGFHASAFSQDFSQTCTKLPEEELILRAELWAHVVVAYQRTCSGSGQANLYSLEIFNEQTQFKKLLEKVPMTLRIQIQISSIITRAYKSLLDLGLLSMTSQQERTMDALLIGFSNELGILDNVASSVWDRLYLAAARQDLVVMHFFKSTTTFDMQSCISIFNVTSNVLEQLQNLDTEYGLHRICPRFLQIALLLSLASMARILKGPFAGYLDHDRGYELFDTGVRFASFSSIQKADFGDRCARLAEQIRKSKRVFRNKDGSINISLHVRNRLSASLWYDALRYWQDEIADHENGQDISGVDNENVLPSDPTTAHNATLLPLPFSNGSTDVSPVPELLLDDELWGDLGTELSDNWDMYGSSIGWMT